MKGKKHTPDQIIRKLRLGKRGWAEGRRSAGSARSSRETSKPDPETTCRRARPEDGGSLQASGMSSVGIVEFIAALREP